MSSKYDYINCKIYGEMRFVNFGSKQMHGISEQCNIDSEEWISEFRNNRIKSVRIAKGNGWV